MSQSPKTQKPNDNLSYRTVKTHPPQARRKPVKREERAKSHLKRMLHAASAVLTSETNVSLDYHAEVREAAAKTRKYLDGGASAYDALINGFVPLFFVKKLEEHGG